MKKMKKTAILFLAIMFMSSSFIIAQPKKSTMLFKNDKHDFGTIKQEGSSYRFEFTNKGKTPIIISDVKVSCGCTTTEWNKQPVKPNGKGYVTAIYNLDKTTGHIEKIITVTSNAENSPVTLTITGIVAEVEKTPEKTYPTKIGILRINTTHANFAAITKGQKKTEELKLYNPTQSTVKVDVANLPSYLTIKITPKDIPAGTEAILSITYDAAKVTEWDFVRNSIYLNINGVKEAKTRINVSAIVKEKFTDEQIKNPPVIKFEETEFNFGTIKAGEKVKHSFIFKNTGKADLFIRKTKATCGCTAVTQSKEAIAPGKSGEIRVVFDSNGKSGSQNKIITVITNSPEKSKILLKIKGSVK